MATNLDRAPSLPTDLLIAVHALSLQWAMNHVDYDTAHDLAADVALRIWRKRRSQLAILKERGVLRQFVFAATRNAQRDRIRRDRSRTRREAVYETDARDRHHDWMSPEDQSNVAQVAHALEAALAHTPRARREAYLMVAERAMSYAAVAAALEISPRTVETRVRRTRIELRETMAKYRNGGAR